MFEYERLNQQKIYKPKTRKIYVLSFVQFNEGFDYYNTSYKARNKNNENTDLNII